MYKTYSDLQIINSDQFNVDGSTIATWEQLRYEINLVKTAMTQDFTTADFGDYSESIKTISTNIATYQEALDKLESGTFTLTDFMELIDQFPDLAKGVDASSKSFNGLSKNLRNAIRNSPKALVGDLKKLFPFPPRPPFRAQYVNPSSYISAKTCPVCESFMTVPHGT